MKEKDYSYLEPSLALKTRINAHKKYSLFSLEEYLQKSFCFSGKRILDIGCGNGNLTHILANKAKLYIGIEKSEELIVQARSAYIKEKNIVLIKSDMDDPFYLPESTFDLTFFIFSVYYTNDPESLFGKVKKLLSDNGQMILIGPTKNNASEIDDFCFEMFGKEKVSKMRSERIEKEFPAIINGLGYKSKIEKINFDLEFPTEQEYLDYIRATLQFRESFNGNFIFEKARELINDKFNKKLTKEVAVLCATK